MKQFSDAAIEAACDAHMLEHSRWDYRVSCGGVHFVIYRRYSGVPEDVETLPNGGSYHDMTRKLSKLRNAAAMRAALAAAIEVDGR